MQDTLFLNGSQSHGITVTENECNKRSGTIYRSSGNVLIVKETSKTIPHNFANTVRGVISSFSPNSGIRMRRYLRETVCEYKQMVTLTYPGFYPGNGKICKEHLKRFLQELKREHDRSHQSSDLGYHSSFWFLEFQQRGAPHFHIFTTWAPNCDWVARRWYEIVGSDDIRHLQAGTRTEYLRNGRAGTISYASKYAAKMEQKECPENFENVGRWWGVTGRRGTMSASTFVNKTNRDKLASKLALNSFWKLINQLIFSGDAQVFIRKQGVLVMNIPEKRDQVRVSMMVSRISASVQCWDSMFIDAELDYGDNYDNRMYQSA